MRKGELKARLEMYERWRDESVLSLEKQRCGALFKEEIEQIGDRVRRRGGLKPNSKGKVAALRDFKEAKTNYDDLAISSLGQTEASRLSFLKLNIGRRS
jgi:hypothetical protein